MTAYYQFVKREYTDNICTAHYQPTEHVQGSWNEHEQHMAPATGLLTVELDNYVFQTTTAKNSTSQNSTPQANMRIARISLDILGVIPFDDVTVVTHCIRPGKTIELIESVMSSRGRPCLIARAWRLITQDTSTIAGLEDKPAPNQPEDLPVWEGMKGWPGKFIESVRLVSEPDRRAGRGMVWITNDFETIAGEPTTDLVKLLGMVDVANGTVPRLGINLSKLEWSFPNTDLQIHMHRAPTGRWLGIEAVQQYGSDGIGLTSAVLHDTQGPFGRSEQILTIRPMPR